MGFSPFKENIGYLQSLVDFENISTAARHLGISQPQLTKSLQNLELELGYKVFERSNRGLRITTRGRELYQKISEVRQAWMSANNVEHDLYGVFKIGAHPIIAFEYMPTLVKSIVEKFPLLTIQYKDRNSKEISDLVSSGTLDLGIAADPANRSGLITKEIAKHKVGVWSTGENNNTIVVNPQIVQFSRYLKKMKYQNIIEAENYEVATAVAIGLGCCCLLPAPVAQKYNLKLLRSIDEISIKIIYSETNRNHPVISNFQFQHLLKDVTLK